ncbi:tRNA (N(6)-L-threonylcarbamoyladenosine(37)-C(2))-methylthiotransferase [Candidatus Pacearchaeota archaeon]|nr:tRNA (N(6)-L-threonylcarbamoyladenosine(37)-C(2))-methylthiotransferase [Candidatus Pacearchaeota archaeon]
MKNYIYIETYGCSANKNNSEIIKGILKQSGYQLTTNLEIAEILIFNTCIVKGKTESKIKRKIQDTIKNYPNKLIIISGCMPETDLESLQNLYPKAIFLGLFHIKEITKLIKDEIENKLTKQKQKFYLSKIKEEKIFLPKIPENKLISITQISEGCLGDCTFCKTKFAKKSLYSYQQDKILKSIESDLKKGAKEVWITSQDNASYMLDKKEISQLPILLKKILDLKHNFKLRLGMMNPENVYSILDELIEIYKNKNFYKFLHIPIQSASNNILKNMNRKYKIEKVIEIINKFKKNILNITISTDIISGYPTEKLIDHSENIQFIKNFKPDVFNLSKFSSHKNTLAGNLKILDKKIINNRATELMNLHRITAKQNKQKFINKQINVFVNKKTNIPYVYESRDINYNIVLITSKNKDILGKNIKVMIKDIGVHHMIGELIL